MPEGGSVQHREVGWAGGSRPARWTCGGNRRSRATKERERRYKGRTAAERVNARLKFFWGAAVGNVTGAWQFHAFVGVILVVPVLFAALPAKAPRWEGTLGQTRLGPGAEALRESPDA